MTSSIEATSSANRVTIDDLGSEEAFLAAIDETIKYFNDGDIVEGTVVKVDRDEVLLDIGYKTEGVIPSRELSIKHDVDPAEVVSVGDHIEALVLTKEDKEGRLILSKKRAQYERAWGTIEKIKEEDGVVRGSVIEVVKGGLILDIGLRGFLPASLVEMRRVRDLQPYVGRELEAKIIELDKNRNNVVLSRRAWLEQTQSEVRTEFLNKLQKGQVRKGVVSSIVNFGAFVDLGGVDGLVHVSELSWKHIDHPSEVVEVGQEVEVEVLDVDLDRERVSLSLKATQEDPWRQFARTHAINQIVPGKVTKLVPFGAFVRVDDGIEGLVHISELAERHVELPEQVVQVGSDVLVKVIDIDLERRRISLSLKQANEGFVEGEEHFDPTLYGMAATYDTEGNYIYPEGFDPETGEWLEGFDKQRETWEKQYADARERWEAHTKQVQASRDADAEAALNPAPAGGVTTRRPPPRRLLSSSARRPRRARRGAGRHPGHRRGSRRSAREARRRQELTAAVARSAVPTRRPRIRRRQRGLEARAGPRLRPRAALRGGSRSPGLHRSLSATAPRRSGRVVRPRRSGRCSADGCLRSPGGDTGPMLKVGLTGGIGAGKSAVAQRLAATRRGDHRRGPAGPRGGRGRHRRARRDRRRVRRRACSAADGELDRPALGARVFGDDDGPPPPREDHPPPGTRAHRRADRRRRRPTRSWSTTCRCWSRPGWPPRTTW